MTTFTIKNANGSTYSNGLLEFMDATAVDDYTFKVESPSVRDLALGLAQAGSDNLIFSLPPLYDLVKDDEKNYTLNFMDTPSMLIEEI
jgi:hypothetical protein